MSEFQYYEFQAIDRPLDESDRQALRTISTRAEITSRRFTNHYEWGDFKGDPDEFMERWFDLHLYVANWGTRRLMIRVPERLVDRPLLNRSVEDSEWIEVREAGENLIIDVAIDEMEPNEVWIEPESWRRFALNCSRKTRDPSTFSGCWRSNSTTVELTSLSLCQVAVL